MGTDNIGIVCIGSVSAGNAGANVNSGSIVGFFIIIVLALLVSVFITFVTAFVSVVVNSGAGNAGTSIDRGVGIDRCVVVDGDVVAFIIVLILALLVSVLIAFITSTLVAFIFIAFTFVVFIFLSVVIFFVFVGAAFLFEHLGFASDQCARELEMWGCERRAVVVVVWKRLGGAMEILLLSRANSML